MKEEGGRMVITWPPTDYCHSCDNQTNATMGFFISSPSFGRATPMQVISMERPHGHVVAGYAEKPDLPFATAGGNEPGT
jgi:hypothetical protein